MIDYEKRRREDEQHLKNLEDLLLVLPVTLFVTLMVGLVVALIATSVFS